MPSACSRIFKRRGTGRGQSSSGQCSASCFRPAYEYAFVLEAELRKKKRRDQVPIYDKQRNPKYPNIYSAGVCVAVPPVEQTPSRPGPGKPVASSSRWLRRASTIRRAATRLGVGYERLAEPSEREKAGHLIFHAAMQGQQGAHSSEDIDRILKRMDLLLDALSGQANS
jgi:hypothetical protein